MCLPCGHGAPTAWKSIQRLSQWESDRPSVCLSTALVLFYNLPTLTSCLHSRNAWRTSPFIPIRLASHNLIQSNYCQIVANAMPAPVWLDHGSHNLKRKDSMTQQLLVQNKVPYTEVIYNSGNYWYYCILQSCLHNAHTYVGCYMIDKYDVPMQCIHYIAQDLLLKHFVSSCSVTSGS